MLSRRRRPAPTADVDVYGVQAVAVAALAPASEVLAVQDEVTASTAFTAARIATAASAALNATAEKSDSAAEDGAVLRSDSEAALRSSRARSPSPPVARSAPPPCVRPIFATTPLAEPPKAGGSGGCDAGSGGAIGSDSIALGVGTAASLRLELPIFDLTASQDDKSSCGTVHKLFAFDIFAPLPVKAGRRRRHRRLRRRS